MITLANAPVSYGVFELSLPDSPLPTGEQISAFVAAAGYAGIDLGPSGLLGTGPELVANLKRHGLGLAGGWIDLPFGSGTDEEFAAKLAEVPAILDEFALVAQEITGPAPKPTLADSGDALRKANPGGGDGLALDAAGWKRFGERITQVQALLAERGLTPTFHHHACTYVETPAEIDQFLEITDMDLTFDTGHLLIGGGDPYEDLARWLPRINHLHLKDARRSVLAYAVGTDDPMRDVWSKRVFVPLGEGDLDVDKMMDIIVSSGYAGWLVVEQDVILTSEADVARAQADQIANREVLRKWFA